MEFLKKRDSSKQTSSVEFNREYMQLPTFEESCDFEVVSSTPSQEEIINMLKEALEEISCSGNGGHGSIIAQRALKKLREMRGEEQ